MKISRTFEVARPRELVWALFQDVARVATCIPGTRITEDCGDGKYKGRVEVKLGPITTAFDGEATHQPDPSRWTGTIAGTGRDRTAGSRARFATQYALAVIDGGTQVSVESDIVLAGAVAQFGRTGLVEEVTTRMLQQFATNLETELAGAPEPPAAAPAHRMDLGALLWPSLWAWLRSRWSRWSRWARRRGGEAR